MDEQKISGYVGIVLLVFGILGIGDIISNITHIESVITVDRFVIGIGLVLWRLSKVTQKG